MECPAGYPCVLGITCGGSGEHISITGLNIQEKKKPYNDDILDFGIFWVYPVNPAN
jgi:hypothetical protein